MQIRLLADHPECIGDLAPEISEHWSSILPQESIASRTAKLLSHCNRDRLPIAWVAIDGGEVLGTAALRIHDLDGREDLSPWLAGVFVKRKFRNQGVAAALCEAAEKWARQFGVQKLYLFTIDHELMYARLGWKVFGKAKWMGIESTIMVKHAIPA